MARGRRSFGGGSRRNEAAPPPAVKVVAPQIDTSKLAVAYELLTFNRRLALRLALDWYNDNLPGLMFQASLTATDQKALDRATKCRAQGDGTSYEEECTTFYEKAVGFYETVWAAKKALPKLADAPTTSSNGTGVYINVLNTLTKTFEPFNVRFGLTLAKDRQLLNNEILLPLDEISAMGLKSPLKMMLDEAPEVAKAASIVVNPDGSAELDGGKFFATLPQVLDAISTWSTTVGGGALTRAAKVKGQKAAVASGPKTPKAPRDPNAPRKSSSKIHLTDVITIVSQASCRGQRGLVFSAIQSGMTVAQFLASAAVVPGVHQTESALLGKLRFYVDEGNVTVAPSV